MAWDDWVCAGKFMLPTAALFYTIFPGLTIFNSMKAKQSPMHGRLHIPKQKPSTICRRANRRILSLQTCSGRS